MRRTLSALLAVLAVAAPWPSRVQAADASGARYASLNLCADQALTMLIAPDRIVGLSRWAADPHVSAVHDLGARLPVLSASAESVLTSGATVVAAGTHGDGKTLALLQRLGVRVVRVAAADSFEDVQAGLLKAGNDLAEPDAAGRMVGELTARRDRLTAQTLATPAALRPLAAYYRPDGGTAGSGTSVDAALDLAGYRNLAAGLGKRGWTGLDLESLILNPPDVIITSFFDGRPWSLHGGFARHPVFRAVLQNTPVIDVPGRLWSCGGWPLMDAAETLAAARPPLVSHERTNP